MQINFIVGMSRSGTNWLAKCLNEHQNVAAFGETSFWGRLYLAPEKDGRYSSHQLKTLEQTYARCPHATLSTNGRQPGCLQKLDSASYPRLIQEMFRHLPERPTPTDVFREFASTVAAAEGKVMAVEKTPHHVNWMDRIVKALPEAKFIVLWRDPYDFMLSYKHQGDRQVSKWRRRFRRLYHPATCAVVWRGYARAISQSQAAFPAKTLLVGFDELTEMSDATLDRVQEFLDLQPEKLAQRVPQDNSSFPDGRFTELEAEDLFWMNLIAAKEMAYFGIQQRHKGVRPLRILWSFVLLPIWLGRNVVLLRRLANSLDYYWRWLVPQRIAS